MGMQFKVADLQREMNYVSEIAGKYLDRGSKQKLQAAANNLKFLKQNRTSEWQIDASSTLLDSVRC